MNVQSQQFLLLGQPCDAEQMLEPLLKKWGGRVVQMQDAEEFFTWLLNQLHDECPFTGIETQKSEKPKTDAASEADPTQEWKTVGKGGQAETIQACSPLASSPVERIFGGRLRSTFKTRQNAGSVSHEPFFVLHLNVWEGVESLEKALMVFMGKEDVSYRSSNTTRMGKKHLKIDSLPRVLVVLFKRFRYDKKTQRMTKLQKFVEYPPILNIRKKLLHGNRHPNTKYLLRAILQHDGRTGAQGHYQCTVYHNVKEWIEINDTKVKLISQQMALKKKAYILIYER